MNQNDTAMEFDLLALLNHLRKKVWIILAVTAVCAILGFLYSTIFLTPQYTASTRIYVLNRSNENYVASSDFQISNYMINDYQQLIKGRNVTSEVISQLGLKMSNGTLSGKITVSSPRDTRMLQISVTDSDPARAAQIANAVREVASKQMKNIMQVDSVTKIYDAEVPTSPSSPNLTKNALLAGAIGFAVIVVVFSLVYLLNDCIRTEEDVERYLGISTLGAIPYNTELGATARKPASKSKRPASPVPRPAPKSVKK